ncbi:EF-P lysine aminoacylase GenX [Guyparkeria hydrothermalis]|nr:EF-P lysine aminoacylase GenX [Guyparkeria hydrothermalis]
MLVRRARLKRCLRETLDERGWLEIDAPSLIDSPDFEPNIALFRVTLADGTPAGSLHSSPELSMKRILSAYPDLPGLYYLGPVFRAGERGTRHNPEFTMLEWYETGADLATGIETSLSLIHAAGEVLGQPASAVERREYGPLFREHCGLDPYIADTESLRMAASEAGITLNDSSGMRRDDWLDLLMSTVIEPTFPAGRLTVVTGYPSSQAAMARLETREFEGRQTTIASRFEIYGGTLELANGYDELTDPAEQARRLGVDGQIAEAAGTQRRFLDALEHDGLPACTGVALGVDRLLMWLTGSDDIDQVIPFSNARA